MKQFVHVTLSVYNSNCCNPTNVTKQELPKYKPDQNPTYRKIAVKEEIIQHFKCYTFNRQKFGVYLHKTIKFQHKKLVWKRDWHVVEGHRTTPEA